LQMMCRMTYYKGLIVFVHVEELAIEYEKTRFVMKHRSNDEKVSPSAMSNSISNKRFGGDRSLQYVLNLMSLFCSSS
jgi:hypothetical protein